MQTLPAAFHSHMLEIKLRNNKKYHSKYYSKCCQVVLQLIIGLGARNDLCRMLGLGAQNLGFAARRCLHCDLGCRVRPRINRKTKGTYHWLAEAAAHVVSRHGVERGEYRKIHVGISDPINKMR